VCCGDNVAVGDHAGAARMTVSTAGADAKATLPRPWVTPGFHAADDTCLGRRCSGSDGRLAAEAWIGSRLWLIIYIRTDRNHYSGCFLYDLIVRWGSGWYWVGLDLTWPPPCPTHSLDSGHFDLLKYKMLQYRLKITQHRLIIFSCHKNRKAWNTQEKCNWWVKVTGDMQWSTQD